MVKSLLHTRKLEERQKTKSVSFAPVVNDAKGLVSHWNRPQLSLPSTELDEEDDVYEVDVSYEEGKPASLDGEGILRTKRRKMLGNLQDERNGEEDIDANYSLLFDDTTDAFASPSLVPVEAFNLNEERTSGDGYFEGDMYIFRRKRKGDEDDEWLKSLKDYPKAQYMDKKVSPRENMKRDVDSGESDNNSEGPTCPDDRKLKQALIIKNMLGILTSPEETVSEAMRRLDTSFRKLSQKPAEVDGNISGSCGDNARQKLKNLSELANELVMMSFEHDVYSIAAVDLKRLHEELISATSTQQQVERNERTSSSATDEPVQWEYCAQDNNIYGPFSTSQMMQWMKQGYFLGESAVRTRKVTTPILQNSTFTNDSNTYKAEDLVADLEDSDEDFEEGDKKKHCNEWMMSDSIDFSKYM
jgi:CD2 antigen cytoplasmic tail-binding protein 2